MTELQMRGSIRRSAFRSRVVGAAIGQLVTLEDRVQGTILVIRDDEENHLDGTVGPVAAKLAPLESAASCTFRKPHRVDDPANSDGEELEHAKWRPQVITRLEKVGCRRRTIILEKLLQVVLSRKV